MPVFDEPDGAVTGPGVVRSARRIPVQGPEIIDFVHRSCAIGAELGCGNYKSIVVSPFEPAPFAFVARRDGRMAMLSGINVF